MAEKETKSVEREYVVPLRREYLKVPQYRRTGKAIMGIKKFIAKHMKVPERDVNKVKIDMHFNNVLWAKGRASPPSKVKVKAVKTGDIVNVTFVETPKHVEFAKARLERLHKPAEKSKKQTDEKKEQSEEQKKEESEKEKSAAESKAAEIKQESNAEKHTTKAQKAARPQRMALQK